MRTNEFCSSGVADEMTSLMRGVITRGTGRSAAIGLGEAWKTGTTDKNVDLWFIGFIRKSAACNWCLAGKRQ